MSRLAFSIALVFAIGMMSAQSVIMLYWISPGFAVFAGGVIFGAAYEIIRRGISRERGREWRRTSGNNTRHTSE